MKGLLVLLLSQLFSLSAQASSSAQLVYLLHEDASYVYYNRDQDKRIYRDQVLKDAIQNSRACPSCEVFVFRRRGSKSQTAESGEFSLYRNGKKVRGERYAYIFSEKTYLENELRLLSQNSKADQNTKKFFFYFGHHIPETEMENSDHSRPKKKFSIAIFGAALKKFTQRFGQLDLLTLSTCENGTPFAIYYLADVAKQVVASPKRLYLAMLKTGVRADFRNPEQVAQEILNESFAYLKSETDIQISLALYDTQQIKNLIVADKDLRSDFALLYQRTVERVSDDQERYIDCSESDTGALGRLPIKELRWRAHMFQREESFSGWSCQ